MTTNAAEALPVLLVDDDNQLLRTLADILRTRGYEPHTASSGREALRMVESRAPLPAIALVDLMLPDMNGMDVVRRLRLASPLTEVVVLTGHASVESAVGALREQSCDYLLKPVAPDLLLATLARAGERWLRHRAEAELQRSEERFRRLIEGIGDVVFLLDPDLVVKYVSPSVGRILGVAPEPLVGRGILEILSGHEPDQDVAEALRRAPAGRHLDLRARHRDGGVRHLQVTVADLRGHPEMPGLILTARDVTEHKELEQQALQAHRLDSIGRLAGGVAHDFNNILSVILGASELALREAGIPPVTDSRLRDIRSASERAARLTRQLLQFARRQPAEVRVFSLRQLVQELSPLFRRLLGASVELVMDLADDLLLVRADPSQIEQVLFNLVVNARDAMPQGGRLTLGSRVCHPDLEDALHDQLPAGGHVVVAVTDTGSGMSEEVRARCLEPFFTTKESGSGSGTGLGLSICYGIVKQAGGTLVLESVPGQGTRAEVVLPSAQDSTAATSVPEPAPLPRGTETVLLVEDDDSVRQVLTAMLTQLGYRVTACTGGEEALARLRGDSRPAILITDVVMPRMSGPQMVTAVRRAWPAVPVLFLSGYPRIEDGDGAPIGPLLSKPFTLGSIARTVRSVLDGHAAPPAQERGPEEQQLGEAAG